MDVCLWVGTVVRMCVSNSPIICGLLPRMKSLRGLVTNKSRDLKVMVPSYFKIENTSSGSWMMFHHFFLLVYCFKNWKKKFDFLSFKPTGFLVSIPMWFRWSNMCLLKDSGITTCLPLSIIPSITAMSSWNVQYVCMSCGMWSLISGQPLMMYSFSCCRWLSCDTACCNCCIVMQSGMSVVVCMAWIFNCMPGISVFLFSVWFCLERPVCNEQIQSGFVYDSESALVYSEQNVLYSLR